MSTLVSSGIGHTTSPCGRHARQRRALQVRPPRFLPRMLCGLVMGTGLRSEACSNPLEVHGDPSRTLSLLLGQEVDVKLQTVGPGEYSSPPTVSSSAVRFLGASFVVQYVPSGPTQVFRFMAVAPGQAIVVFHHTGANPEVDDTMNVH